MTTEARNGLRANIAEVALRIDQDIEYLFELVALARDERMTWDEIADALGTTKQAAWQRFRNAVPSTH